MSDYGLFWDSRNGDRLYNATSMEEWLRPFFKTGVFNGHLQVTATSGMTISVSPGYCNINGKIRHFEQAQTFTLASASGYTDRIDSVVLERNEGDREISVKIITGTGNNRVAPVRESGIYQLVLAYIFVGRGVTAITQSVITDTRMDSSLCGWVAATVDEIDFDQIHAQFTAWMAEKRAQFIAWMNQEQSDFEAWENTQQSGFESWRDTQENTFDTWASNQRSEYESWISDQQTAFSSWRSGQESDFSSWRSSQQSDFSSWRDTQENTFETWEATQQTAFEAWVAGLQDILDEDTAAHLQNEIEDLQDAVEQAGHDIYDSSGTLQTKRKGLQFGDIFNLTDDQDGDKIIISSPVTIVNGEMCVTFNSN